MSPLNLNDLAGLSKISEILVGPLFACAIYTQWSTKLLSHVGLGTGFVASAALFVLLIAVCSFAVMAVAEVLFKSPPLYAFSGLVAIGVGLLGLGELARHSGGSIAIYWHLGALCYGLGVFSERSAKAP